MTPPGLYLVPFGLEAKAWPALLPYFQRLAGKVETSVTPENILARAQRQELMLWRINEGWCLVGALATGIKGDAAFVEAVAGDRMRVWLGPCLEDLEDRCRNAGLKRLTMRGRRGWSRVLSRYGYHDAGGGKLTKDI